MVEADDRLTFDPGAELRRMDLTFRVLVTNAERWLRASVAFDVLVLHLEFLAPRSRRSSKDATSGNSHFKPSRSQVAQEGFCSSHFFRRSRQMTHPFFVLSDFDWRAGIGRKDILFPNQGRSEMENGRVGR